MSPTAHNLCLHYLDPSGRRRLALTPDALRALIDAERAAGRAPAALADYLTAAPGPDRFTLSFDDAHRSVLLHAAPVLRALEVPATLFVPTAYVGTSDEFLTWDELRALRDAGWTLGSHTATHPRMSWRVYDEDERAHAARLYDECARARDALERELGQPCELFAYPYGEAPPAAREAVRRAGHRAAFTVREALEWDGDALMIPRVEHGPAVYTPASAGDDAGPTAISVVVPAFERVEILGEVVRRLSAQSYPRERFEVVVVDDGSREDLAPAFVGAAPNVRLVPRAGDAETFRAGQARQRGADEARFDTLAFLDADVVVGRDFLWHLDWVHRRVPRAVVLGYLSGYNLHDLGFVHTLADVRPLAEPDAALALIPDRSREPTLRSCLDNLDWIEEPWRLAYTGNMSLSRALLREVGGFARDFEGWGLEDIDLGIRLHRAGACWVFSRFAVGYHLLDPGETSAPRNPFRQPSPTRAHFERYLTNLATLQRRHPDDEAVTRFCEQSLHDVEETCSRPDTVGIELGGASSLDLSFHRALHRCQPGGVTLHEALDRVAYARKVGAKQVYILGGEPAEHPGFLALLRESRRAGIRRVIAETNATPFADEALARAARDAGLDHAVIEVHAFEREAFERTTRRVGSFDRFVQGLAHLERAGISRSARVIVSEATAGHLAQTLARLAGAQIAVDEVLVVGDDELAARVAPVLAAHDLAARAATMA